MSSGMRDAYGGRMFGAQKGGRVGGDGPLTPEEYSRMKALEGPACMMGRYDMVEPTSAVTNEFRCLRDRYLAHGVVSPEGDEADG